MPHCYHLSHADIVVVVIRLICYNLFNINVTYAIVFILFFIFWNLLF